MRGLGIYSLCSSSRRLLLIRLPRLAVLRCRACAAAVECGPSARPGHYQTASAWRRDPVRRGSAPLRPRAGRTWTCRAGPAPRPAWPAAGRRSAAGTTARRRCRPAATGATASGYMQPMSASVRSTFVSSSEQERRTAAAVQRHAADDAVIVVLGGGDDELAGLESERPA